MNQRNASGTSTQYPRTSRTGAIVMSFIARNMYPMTIDSIPAMKSFHLN